MKLIDLKDLLVRHTPQEIIEKLTPYLSEKRRARIETLLQGRINSIQLALESPYHMHNANAVFRTCEALGIHQVHIIAPEGEIKRSNGVARGASYWINLHVHDSLTQFLEFIKQRRMKLAGACVTGENDLRTVPINSPVCILLGNEHRGLSEAAKKACDVCYSINMQGMTESLNLSVSAAISLYELANRRRELLKTTGDLSAQELLEQRAWYFACGVNPRMVKQMFLKE